MFLTEPNMNKPVFLTIGLLKKLIQKYGFHTFFQSIIYTDFRSNYFSKEHNFKKSA